MEYKLQLLLSQNNENILFGVFTNTSVVADSWSSKLKSFFRLSFTTENVLKGYRKSVGNQRDLNNLQIPNIGLSTLIFFIFLK